MAFIKVLKDSNDNTIYPQSMTAAVLDANGNSLDTIHQKFITASATATNVEDVEIEYEKTYNKVSAIDINSTNVQYPSAKAVYNAIIENKSVGVKIITAATKEEIQNPETTAIYLIGTESPYEEYIYLDGGDWELIGSTSVDLSDYATKAEIPTKTSELENDSNYATKSELPTVASDIGAIAEPITEGAAGQVLTTDGAGNRSWTTPNSGGSSFSIATGTIANNGIIPKTAGYNNYAYFVSMNTFEKNSGYTFSASTKMHFVHGFECYVNQTTRNVTAVTHWYFSTTEYDGETNDKNETANYIEIAWN